MHMADAQVHLAVVARDTHQIGRGRQSEAANGCTAEFSLRVVADECQRAKVLLQRVDATRADVGHVLQIQTRAGGGGATNLEASSLAPGEPILGLAAYDFHGLEVWCSEAGNLAEPGLHEQLGA